MLVDSHCHLNLLDLSLHDGDVATVIDKAEANGVGYFLCVSVSLERFNEVRDIARKFVNVFASVGVHPTEQDCQDPSVAELVALADDPVIIAIGETGLDYFHCPEKSQWQLDRFRTHIEAAKQTGKPLIIHSRESKVDTIQVMRDEKADEIGGVMHCFAEDWAMAKQALDLGFYISFSGIVTFKNAKNLHEVAKKVPIDRMLIETDSPYLAPTPFRGKPNEPAYVKYVAEHIAELRGDSFENIAKASTENFFRLFKLLEHETSLKID